MKASLSSEPQEEQQQQSHSKTRERERCATQPRNIQRWAVIWEREAAIAFLEVDDKNFSWLRFLLVLSDPTELHSKKKNLMC